MVSSEGRIFTLSDMISMSYAKTFVNSSELFGMMEVQKFKDNKLSLHYISLLYPLFKFTPSVNSLIVSLVNVIFLLLISLRVTSLSLVFSSGNKKISYFLGGLILFQYPLLFWSLRGYEVGVISLLLIYLVDQIVKYDPSFEKSDRSKILKIYALLSIGVLIRIDFIVILFGISCYFLVFKIKNFQEFFIFHFITL